MSRIVHIFLICVAFGSFVAIIAVAARDHPSLPSAPASVVTVAVPTDTDGSSNGSHSTTINAPVTTITFASPQAPLSSADPGGGGSGVGAGRPASFWQLTLAYPTYCNPGTAVQPVLSWNAADTDTVAVSVDDPATVGGDGFFESINTLTMPSIACIGVEGDALPTHEYEIDAFGTDHTVLHVELKVNIRVAPDLQQSDAKQAV
jgi:hypothetical protein